MVKFKVYEEIAWNGSFKKCKKVLIGIVNGDSINEGCQNARLKYRNKSLIVWLQDNLYLRIKS